MKKALVIVYYWPPSGGSAVQRWLKFTRYMPENGWEPVVFAPENASYPETDPSLEQKIPVSLKVIRHPILEPYDLYRRFTGMGRQGKIAASMTIPSRPGRIKKALHGLSLWVRGNFFIPDARMLWIRPSVTYLEKYLKENPVDVIVSTGPPHSLHLIARKLHKLTRIPWVADFRDPWTGIDFYKDLKISFFADKTHHRLEKMVLNEADAITCVGNQMASSFRKITGRQVAVITNGFDEEDLPANEPAADTKFSLLHIGTLPKSRNSDALWKALAEKASTDERFASDLAIKLIGNVDHTVWDSIDKHELRRFIEHIPYLEHDEALTTQLAARVLLLLINDSPNAKGVITGKFYEYLMVKRPVLLIGPVDGEAASILREAGAGLSAGFHDTRQIRAHIDEFYSRYCLDHLEGTGKAVSQFSRRLLTKEFCRVLDNISAPSK